MAGSKTATSVKTRVGARKLDNAGDGQPHAGIRSNHNALLASLSEPIYKQLTPYLSETEIAAGEVFFEPEQEIEFAYFPTAGLLSVLAVMNNGESAEIGCVGMEGMVGLEPLFGDRTNLRRCIGQSPGRAFKIEIQKLKELCAAWEPLRRVLLEYSQRLFREVSQTAACNRLHPVEERLARWLLISADRTKSDTLGLTHDFLANMLGVRRSTVTLSTGVLQDSNIIRYKRGHIEIIDRKRLEQVSCECYALLKDKF